MLKMYSKPWIQDFTTNPTLMHKAGISDYAALAKHVVEAIPGRPISSEVFSDDAGLSSKVSSMTRHGVEP